MMEGGKPYRVGPARARPMLIRTRARFSTLRALSSISQTQIFALELS